MKPRRFPKRTIAKGKRLNYRALAEAMGKPVPAPITRNKGEGKRPK